MKRMKYLMVVSLSIVAIGGLCWAVDEDSPAGELEWQWAEPSASATDGLSVFELATRNAPGGTVITNESLGRLGDDEPFATETTLTDSSEISEQPPAVSAEDPLDRLLQYEAAAAERKQRIAEAQRDLDAAQAKLANLEVQLMATRNPFSRRPKLSEEEIEHRLTSGETALERFERTQLLVEEARGEVLVAGESLARARASE